MPLSVSYVVKGGILHNLFSLFYETFQSNLIKNVYQDIEKSYISILNIARWRSGIVWCLGWIVGSNSLN